MLAVLRCPWVPFASGCRADGVLALPKVGQASHLLLPTSLALTAWAADLWQPRDARSESRRPVCCCRANAPRCRRGRGAGEARAGLSNPRSRRPNVPRSAPSPDASIRPASSLASRSSHRVLLPQNLRAIAAICAARVRFATYTSPLCISLTNRAERAAPQRSCKKIAAALQEPGLTPSPR